MSMKNLLFDRNANRALINRFEGRSIFSVLTGPSVNNHDLSQLKDRYTFTVKQLPITHLKPTIWLCMEKPQIFPAEIWDDRTIIKVVCNAVYEKGYLREKNGIQRFEPVNKTTNIYWFKLSNSYSSEKYLTENSVQWGNNSEITDEHGIKGRRSIMFAHFRLLHYMGFKKIYLLGVDFDMQEAIPYCYDRVKTKHAVQQNNILYDTLKIRLAAIYPKLLDAGIEVYNCNPQSKLEVFPFKSYEECLNDSDSYLHRN